MVHCAAAEAINPRGIYSRDNAANIIYIQKLAADKADLRKTQSLSAWRRTLACNGEHDRRVDVCMVPYTRSHTGLY